MPKIVDEQVKHLFLVKFGEHIKKLRIEKGLTQKINHIYFLSKYD